MGGGVIGVTTAYYVARSGHEVTVIERQPGVAAETSFANAGILAPGHAHAWASPSAPMTLLKSLVRGDTALRLRLRIDPKMWLWGLHFLRNCTAARNRANTLCKLRLCLYSVEALKALREEAGIAYDERTEGALYLYREPAQLDAALANMALLTGNGLAMTTIDRDRIAALEPALAHVKDKFAGGIHCPVDESGDSHLFSRKLAEVCETMGVSFRFGTSVTGLKADGDRIEGVVTDKGDVAGDAYVLSLANDSPFALRGLGVRLPIYPVKGYSVTVPTEGYNGAPRLPGVDEEYLVAFARFGERLRLTGTAEFAGYDTSFEPADFTQLLNVARELFPGGADYARPDYWACLRPMTPDGPPVFGRGRHRNLYFNTGHGHIGWTMACGSGRVTADLIDGREPDIDLTGMTVDRFN